MLYKVYIIFQGPLLVNFMALISRIDLMLIYFFKSLNFYINGTYLIVHAYEKLDYIYLNGLLNALVIDIMMQYTKIDSSIYSYSYLRLAIMDI